MIADEYSDWIWAYGMKNKSETKHIVRLVVRRVERKTGREVEAYRCDGAGENVLEDESLWSEKTCAHTPHQNGKSEKLGGVVWCGGQSFLHGGNLPEENWLHCAQAFVHVRNRLPTSKWPNRSPYEVFHALNDGHVNMHAQIESFRRVGSLCFVTLPHNVRRQRGKNCKRSFRALMLGYSDQDGQKGYRVQELATGKIHTVSHAQLFKCYEDKLVFDKSDDYDAWLDKKQRALSKSTSKSTSKSAGESSCSESESSSCYSSESESTSESDEDNQNKVVFIDDYFDSTQASMSRARDVVTVDDDDDHDEMLARLERGEPLNAPRSPPTTRQQERAREEKMPSLDAPAHAPDGECGNYDSHEAKHDAHVDDNSGDEGDDDGGDETGEEEWEVEAIDAFRRVGRKRGAKQYRTVWKGGEVTWEPAKSFRLDELNEETGSKYLPLFDDFIGRVERGEVDEHREGVSSEVGERSAPVAGTSPTHSNNLELDESTANAIAEKIRKLESIDKSKKARVLKSIVKGGVRVPENRKEAKQAKQWEEFLAAEAVELKSFEELDVWELVPLPKGRKAVGTRWVYDVKVDVDGCVLRHKARLVAQGFSQKQGIDYNETFAPTMHIKTARVLLSLAARSKLVVKQYDVSTAFLHASLREEVYVKQPPGHVVKGKEEYVYKLKKAMYGLKNAPKAYSDHFMGILSRLGFKQSSRDECLWSYKKGNYFVHYLFHVDDVLVVANNDLLRESLFKILKRELRIRDEGLVSKFLGMRVERLADGSYTMDQQSYIEKMAELFCVNDDTKTVQQPGIFGQHLTLDMLPQTEEEKKVAEKLPMRQLTGGLIYVNKTRPEVAYAISDVARFMSKWGVEHFKRALLILKFLYSTRHKKLVFSATNTPFELACYADANYGDGRDSGEAADDKWKSQGGYLVFLGDCLVSWRSRRHKSRCLSSMESEYMEASEASKEVVYFRELMREIGYEMSTPTVLYEDNKACMSFSKNNTNHDRSKHIDIRAYALRDKVREGVIKLKHVDTKHQLADMMTKHQQKATFIKHMEKIYSADSMPPRSSTWKVRSAHDGMCACLSCFTCGV